MNSDQLKPITDNSLKDYLSKKEENMVNKPYLQRWIDYKKRNFSNFLGYAYDEKGDLYRRDFLSENKWVLVDRFIQSDLKR